MRKVLATILVLTACVAQAQVDVTVTVDFGRDQGQNFGTLFEAADASGRRAFGAGFAAAYNSYYRHERYKLQFYIRPRENSEAYTVEQLSRASGDTGVYIYDLGDALYARGHGNDRPKPKAWNGESGVWNPVPTTQLPGENCATVRGKVLAAVNGRLCYDSRPILDPPARGEYHGFYNGQEWLTFYHRYAPPQGTEGSFNSVVAVPWSPYGHDLRVDMSKARTLRITYMPEFPYGQGQLRNEIVTCSNMGGFYAFDGDQWHVRRRPDDQVSYQIYAMINYGDRLLMPQYPSGNLIEYDGAKLTTLTGWPPVPPDVAPDLREAQTAMIYRGELFVGVWPWSELWRLDGDTGRWVFLRRMFSHPPSHKSPVHPYEREMREAGRVWNLMGQRLTGLVPQGPGLFVSTGSKDGQTMKPEELPFLTPQQRLEYGEVYCLRMPGNLAAVIRWNDQPTTLRFVARNGRMSIEQDGRVIGSAEVDAALLAGIEGATVKWGEGVFGPLRGTVMERSAK